MSDFQDSIAERLTYLQNTNDFVNKKTILNRTYTNALVDSEWNDITKINDFQAAFLDLLNEKHSTLHEQFRQSLSERFHEMYNNSDDEKETQFSPSKELALHCIQIPSNQSDDWQIMYEMKSDDTIFHVDFKGWKYESIGITH